MVRTLSDLNNNPRGNNNPAGNPFAMGRMGRDFEFKSIPICFYLFLIIMIALMIMSSMWGVGGYFVNITPDVILKLQIWRLFFSYFFIVGLISLLFTALVLFSLSMTEETALGSGRFFAQVFYRNLGVQVGVALIGLVLYAAFNMHLLSFGIWPVYFVYLTKRCLENPDEVTYFCMMPCPIQNRYYPLLLLLLFTLLGSNFGLPVDIWVGYGLGHLIHKNLMIRNLIEPKLSVCVAVQNFLMKFDGRLGKVVPLTDAPATENAGTQPAAAGQERATAEVIRPVFGGSGVAIGGTAQTGIYNNYDYLEKQAYDLNEQKKAAQANTTQLNPPIQPVVAEAPKKKNNDDSL